MLTGEGVLDLDPETLEPDLLRDRRERDEDECDLRRDRERDLEEAEPDPERDRFLGDEPDREYSLRRGESPE